MFWKEEEIVEERNSLLKTKEREDHRLKKNKHFSYIYRKGKRKNTKNLTLFTAPSRYRTFKVGISVNKKIGKANVRNKLKRRIREIVRIDNLPKEYNNYIILTREGSQELSFDGLRAQLKELFSWNTFYYLLNT